MPTYTDAYLEYYANRYVAHYFKGHGITLQQYLAAPDRYEYLAYAPFPLLPAQNNVVLRLWHAWDTGLSPVNSEPAEEPFELPGVYAVWEEFLLDLGNNKAIRQRNGAFIEPLRHHRHNARNRSANFARKGA